MQTDRAHLAARIREAHRLPSFTTGSVDDFTSTVVAEALATENITLTVTITARRFAVGPGRWDRAAAGTVVTVTVASCDTASGARRHVDLAEPEAWVRAVFAEFDDDDQRIYLLGGIDPDTGRSERGLFAYRAYFDEDATPIGVPTQLVDMPHYWIGTLH
ncbi:N-formylglutamate amidohydrolase [Rhodococcus sp. CX]|uniref:N-formylglutamate amidohydrolase n=1 Tax=Rhodococcus sp. CX TaxID=2789880 RepID=UPI0018CF4303|nr:N-formylglutamate amidohydrolase [Rhodococcus sp. CX]MBH0120011.1 N-formylglutamate amidohydrolase [Rhodococcus sp. CX]